ncbi:MAG TPA: extracellular solute-binding protein, partial [Thermodesulfobacteriota bacterium]|nr:extracellular solute-binding protein [Thermodesulfobacteriota bacterium]
ARGQPAAAAPARPAAPASLVEEARKEREVVWYTAMNIQDAQAVAERLKTVHPFLTLTIHRQPGEKIRNRILTETQAGQFLWDVVSVNHLDIDILNRQGLLAAYRSPETRTGFPPGAVDPEGRWAAIYVREFVIGYNTRLVPKEQAPRDWPDLLDPKWKGKFALDADDVEWFAAMLDYWGREKGLAFMRALAAQQPEFRRGHTLLSQLLVAGEFPLALVFPNEVEQAKRRGAPVEWVGTLDPVITSPSQIAISARAPHPSAARLFVDFMLSAEGQQVIRERGRVPARTDLPPGPDRLGPIPHPYYVPPRLARELAQYEKEFRAVFFGERF